MKNLAPLLVGGGVLAAVVVLRNKKEGPELRQGGGSYEAARLRTARQNAARTAGACCASCAYGGDCESGKE